MTQPKVGDIVRSAHCATWGRGKVVAVDGGKIFVAFENEGGNVAKRLIPSGLQVLPGESIPMLEFLPPFTKVGNEYVLDHTRRTLNELLAHFISCFPGRFDDPDYIGEGDLKGTGERAYKIAAHKAFVETFGYGRGEHMVATNDGDGIAQGLGRVLKMQNMLATQELIALLDALQDGAAAVAYLSALNKFLGGPPTRVSFEQYAFAVEGLPKKGQFRVATWPIATLLPFLSLKWDNMFLKPEVTKKAAAVMGVDLRYESHLNWTTYERLVRLTSVLTTILAPLGAKDVIDVQSFIWVSFEYP